MGKNINGSETQSIVNKLYQINKLNSLMKQNQKSISPFLPNLLVWST